MDHTHTHIRVMHATAAVKEYCHNERNSFRANSCAVEAQSACRLRTAFPTLSISAAPVALTECKHDPVEVTNVHVMFKVNEKGTSSQQTCECSRRATATT